MVYENQTHLFLSTFIRLSLWWTRRQKSDILWKEAVSSKLRLWNEEASIMEDVLKALQPKLCPKIELFTAPLFYCTHQASCFKSRARRSSGAKWNSIRMWETVGIITTLLLVQVEVSSICTRRNEEGYPISFFYKLNTSQSRLAYGTCETSMTRSL